MDAAVIVLGRGEARSMPDSALLDAMIDAESATRDAAYGEAAEAASRVDEVLRARADAVRRATTAALFVHPKTRWKRGESQRSGWRAGRRTELEVTAFDQLGDLIAELAAAGATITGPVWQLDATNAVFGEARRIAGADARSRAEDYAGALGLSLGDVEWIAEPGLRGQGGSIHDGLSFRAAAFAGAAPGGPEETISVTPDEMTVQASVEVGFNIRSNPE